MLYNRMLFDMLDHHRKVRENYLFPQIDELLGQRRLGAMAGNTKRHQGFKEGLGVFEKYVKVTKAEEFCGRTFMHIIDSFGEDLVQHLHNEIPTLLSLHTLDSEEMMRIWKRAEQPRRLTCIIIPTGRWSVRIAHLKVAVRSGVFRSRCFWRRGG